MYKVLIVEDDNGYSYSSACKDVERDNFYSTFGGLFFIGICAPYGGKMSPALQYE